MPNSFNYLNILQKHVRPGTVTRTFTRAYSTHINSNAKVNHELEKARLSSKPYRDIPSKKGILPAWLDLMLSGGPGYLHEHCDRRHSELGPIYRDSLGSTELVFVADTNLIRTILANEGKYPIQNIPPAWIYYNKVHKVDRGLFFQFGEPWARMRHAMNKVLLSRESISKFTGDILQINDDLFDTWISNYSSSLIVDNVKEWLCKWSIESTGFILFGHRMGCFPKQNTGMDHNESQASQLVESVSNMFKETSKFQVLPVELAHRLNLSAWKRFEATTSKMLQVAGDYTSRNMTRLKQSKSLEKPSIVRDLIDLGELNDEEINRSIVDLMIASADTTSNSLQWMLYALAKHPEVQGRILTEPSSQTTPGQYLKAFCKECLRLYPTAPFLARTLDKDITLAGYLIPAGKTLVLSLYTTSRMSKYFEEPHKFLPERWLRNDPQHESKCPRGRNHAYASLPFGLGSRNCVGRRAAELEMNLFIASLVERFEILPADDGDIGIKLKMILEPEKPIRIKIRPRVQSTKPSS